jgi:magnesium chelatase family protein
MPYKTLSAAVYGIDVSIIEVEVDVSGIKCDEDHSHTVGLPMRRCARAATGCVRL